MRLLLFSDIHRDLAASTRLVERSAEADIAIAAGDLATIHEGLDDVIAILRQIECPVVVVPGNGETFEELQIACRVWDRAIPLHGSGVTVLDQSFYGLGGGVPVTPFGDWSFDLTETEAAELLTDCRSGAVLISHSPPKGAVDRGSDGRSIGSKAVRDTIIEKSPKLVVCGHVHACWGQEERVGTTPIVNAGPAGILWDLEAGRRIDST